MKLLARDDDALLGHAQVPVQCEGPLAPLHPLLPARLFVSQGLLRFGALGCGRRGGLPSFRQACLGRLAFFFELRVWRQPGLEPVDFVTERVATLTDALLGERELLVPQHA